MNGPHGRPGAADLSASARDAPGARPDLFAVPRPVTGLEECFFTHTIDLPGHGTIQGQWDLRPGLRDYTGHVEVAGKTVLDVGCASGFVSFALEAMGAEVIAFDLAQGRDWDIPLYAGSEREFMGRLLDHHLQQIRSAFWFSHEALGSRTRLALGTADAIPEGIGPVDIAFLGIVLSHLRDPLRGLRGALRLTRETAVVTEVLPKRYGFLRYVPARLGLPMLLAPRAARRDQIQPWWILGPETVREFLRMLGFGESVVTFHHQPMLGQRRLCYTVVARRTEPTNPDL
ncbi:class I SAM-dependent methyltransferase [Methylobacterium nodulans]|uniref:Methyltransferase type 12 n=1 Tax=Methylobacterium nodulans (strain LMG 21967 / CNCM I-2342 / ORS 2060) TaxID=460265 RepID=B8IEW2_METNO|nr:class I SAM-dependent methyltransferase [Methylobacterium nodulans]ACL61455.1 Methyltransferase type 12 [Methylobacterium nodulans ORS 2060]